VERERLYRRPRSLEGQLGREMERRALGFLAVHQGGHETMARRDGFPEASPAEADPGFLAGVLQGEERRALGRTREGFLLWAGVPLRDGDRIAGALVAGAILPDAGLLHSQEIRRASENYIQARARKPEIKQLFVLLFVMFTLLTIFAATWFGLTFARGITEPVRALTEGTREVQAGNLGVHLEVEARDELGTLVTSFNDMVRELNHHKTEAERASRDLRIASEVSEARRRYIETLLENVTTGVVSLDAKGSVTLVNRAASRMLGVPEGEECVGLVYTELLSRPGHEPLRAAAGRFLGVEDAVVTREMVLDLGARRLDLAASFASLRDGRGVPIGMLIVLEDLSELIRAQRVAAWREVARRLAHEIKNPLTPIQLSVQRMLKRHREGGPDLGSVLEEGAETIRQEVAGLQRLVDEFSRFARLPTLNPVPADIGQVVEGSLKLYEGREDIVIERDLGEVPVVNLDPEQMRRVLKNLVDNAIEAQGDGARVTVRTAYLSDAQVVRVEVADQGPGIPEEMRDRLFVPYFSTKEDGSGLGLAIVHRIVLDHKGRIRVEDNEPHGSRFVVEIPA
ncbi:MAG: sensor histidine kinase, partial [Methanopyraceae archaeon]